MGDLKRAAEALAPRLLGEADIAAAS